MDAILLKWFKPEWVAGYKNDQNGIMRRYEREHLKWDPHLINCHTQILDFVSFTDAKKVLVLGSGWLLDVPIDKLIERDCTVTLADVYHPEKVKHRYSKSNNVICFKTDLTGGLIKDAVESSTFERFVTKMHQINLPFDVASFDAIVSVNLLNQLDIILCDYLIKRFDPKPDDLQMIREFIQTFHLKWLSAKKTLIISDVLERCVLTNGATLFEKTLVHVPFLNYTEIAEWDWVFDTHYRYNTQGNTVFKVKVYKTELP